MTNEEAIAQLECLRDSAEMFEEFAENCEALQMAIEALKKQIPNDMIGKPVYKFRISRKSSEEQIAMGWRKEYHYIAENAEAVRNNLRWGNEITIEERPCTKTDIARLGKAAFQTRKGAEKALFIWTECVKREVGNEHIQ